MSSPDILSPLTKVLKDTLTTGIVFNKSTLLIRHESEDKVTNKSSTGFSTRASCDNIQAKLVENEMKMNEMEVKEVKEVKANVADVFLGKVGVKQKEVKSKERDKLGRNEEIKKKKETEKEKMERHIENQQKALYEGQSAGKEDKEGKTGRKGWGKRLTFSRKVESVRGQNDSRKELPIDESDVHSEGQGPGDEDKDKGQPGKGSNKWFSRRSRSVHLIR